MKRGIAGFFIFVFLVAGVVGCGAAVEPEAQETIAPIETATTGATPTIVETTAVEATPTVQAQETPEAEATSDSAENSDVLETPEATKEGGATMTPSGTEMGEDLPQVELAKADLAERLNVAPEAIEVVLVEARTWPDAGMGCPQPGMVYTQVPQDGLLIRLRVEGQDYDYHSGGIRDPFLCEEDGKGTQEFGEELIPPPSMDE